jgi:hypothetical protein
MLKLYNRQDGEAADWKLIAETLFKAAFDVLDKLPDDACRSMARWVHEGSYGRVTDGPHVDPAASKTPVDKPEPGPAFTGDLKSRKPKPPR